MNNNTIPASENGNKQEVNSDNRVNSDDDFSKFPVGTFSPTVRKFLGEAADSLVCPVDLVGLPMLVMLSSAIGTSRVIKLKGDWSEGATIYGVSIARPGGKKTPAANKAFRPVYDEQSRLLESYRRECDQCEDEDEKPELESVYVDDTTVEALSVVLQNNPRGLLLSRDELTSWVRGMDKYNGGKGNDRQFWLSMWSNNPVRVDRKSNKGPIIIPNPFVSVYGTIQPKILPEIGAGREDGMLDRFLFAFPDEMLSGWTDDVVSDETNKTLQDLYTKLRDLDTDEEGKPKQVGFSDDAKELFVELFNEHDQEKQSVDFPEHLLGYWSKLESYFARLILILSVVRSIDEGGEERIESADVLKAWVLLTYFKGQARRVHDVLYEEDTTAKFASDVLKFVSAMGGYFKDEPAVVLALIRSNHKPARSNELTKKLKNVSRLVVDSGQSNSRRYLSLSTKNVVAVDSVVAVDPLTEDEAKEGWRETMLGGELSQFYLMRLVDDYIAGKPDSLEKVTRLVLYALDRPAHDWERHKDAVEPILKRRLAEIEVRKNEPVPF